MTDRIQIRVRTRTEYELRDSDVPSEPVSSQTVVDDVADLLVDIDEILEEDRVREWQLKMRSINFIRGGTRNPCKDAIRVPADMLPFYESLGYTILDCGDCDDC